jgi:hypothetical protein
MEFVERTSGLAPCAGEFKDKDWFSAVALTPDERTLAATDIAGMVHVWEFEG